MIEKTPDETRYIERNKVMDDALRKTLLSKIARGHRACCDQHSDAARPDAIDERQNAGQFADAGTMQPDQGSIRPQHSGFASALGQSLMMLFAALQALSQKNGGERPRRRGQ